MQWKNMWAFFRFICVFKGWLTSPKALMFFSPLKHILSPLLMLYYLMGKRSHVSENENSPCHLEKTLRLDIIFFSTVLAQKQKFPCAIMQITCKSRLGRGRGYFLVAKQGIAFWIPEMEAWLLTQSCLKNFLLWNKDASLLLSSPSFFFIYSVRSCRTDFFLMYYTCKYGNVPWQINMKLKWKL